MLAAGGVILLLATTGQLANARNGFAATLVILIGVVLGDRADLAAAAGLACARSAPPASGRRSAPRSPRTCTTPCCRPWRSSSGTPTSQQAVSRLARSQERELRAWLYDPKVVREGGTWAGLVAGMVAEVEADHALIVDPVVVGDAPVDEALAALGAATREALVNAAKHSGAHRGRPLHRGDPRAGVGLRARPRQGVRPGDGARRPARAARTRWPAG